MNSLAQESKLEQKWDEYETLQSQRKELLERVSEIENEMQKKIYEIQILKNGNYIEA